MRRAILIIMLLCGTWAGCGTSKWSDTQRTATEQLLISDAMDRAVSELDFRALAGKAVYLDTDPLKSATDAAYLTSTLRQHMLASGCILKDKREEADYVIEARAGSSGTDNHSLLFGVPQTTLPSVAFVPGASGAATIPEIPLVKKMDQRAIIKVALFAYNRETGRPVWQSGLVLTESKAKHLWVFGTGPFQNGTIYEGTNFAGDKLKMKIPLIDPDEKRADLSVADEAYFIEPPEELAEARRRVAQQRAAAAAAAAAAPPKPEGPASGVMPAGHAAPVGGPSGQPPVTPGQSTGPSQASPFSVPSNAPSPPGNSGLTIPYIPGGFNGLYPSTR